MQNSSQYQNPKISLFAKEYLSEVNPLDKTVTHYNQCALTIEKIGITNVPVVLNVDWQNSKTYLKALEDGVAHMKGTALPGNFGNSVIFGHSSSYPWAKGSYKTVFAKLNQLENHDEIKAVCDDQVMRFSVQEKKIVKPQNLEILNKSGGEFLTLMTCWPPGSIAKRLVVVALEAGR